MSQVFEDSKKKTKEIETRLKECGDQDTSELSATEIAEEAAAELHREARLSERKLYRRVTI